MKVYISLLTIHDYNYKNFEDSFCVKAFKTDEERLNGLVQSYEVNLNPCGCRNGCDCEHFDDIKKCGCEKYIDIVIIKKRKLLKIKDEYKTYEGLKEIGDELAEGEYLNCKISFELSEFDL